jgi:hypothetical protein
MSNRPTALQIQQKRDADDLANHRERIVWLTGEDPRWACGTRVDTFMRNVLLVQSRAVVARLEALTAQS